MAVQFVGLFDLVEQTVAGPGQFLFVVLGQAAEYRTDAQVAAQQVFGQVVQGGNAQGHAQDRELDARFPLLDHAGQFHLLLVAEQVLVAHLAKIEVHRVEAATRAPPVAGAPVRVGPTIDGGAPFDIVAHRPVVLGLGPVGAAAFARNHSGQQFRFVLVVKGEIVRSHAPSPAHLSTAVQPALPNSIF